MELGILLNPNHRHEAVELYHSFAEQAGVRVSTFTFNDLIRRPSVPAIIHNRTYAHNEPERRILHQLERKAYVFNGGNRFAKSQIHAWLMTNSYFRPNLPATKRATVSNIQEAMQKYAALVLKPDLGAIGRGVRILWKANGIWQCQQGLHVVPYRVIKDRLHAQIRRTPMVLQQRLPLAKAFGHVFDLRVSVQRGATGTWQVTGMVGKHATDGHQTTNLAQGGKAFRVETVLSTAKQEIVAQFALAVAMQLSLYVPRLADIGLDVGVTDAGFPMLIECNFRDLRYSFSAAGMTEVWQRTYQNPILYARSIARGLVPAV